MVSRIPARSRAAAAAAAPGTALAMIWPHADLPPTASDQPLVGCMFQGTVVVLLALLALVQALLDLHKHDD